MHVVIAALLTVMGQDITIVHWDSHPDLLAPRDMAADLVLLNMIHQ